MSDYLALEWGRRQLRGVAASVSAERVQVKHCFALTCPDEWDVERRPEDAGHWLKGQLAERGISARHVVVALPREDIVVRRIELPEAPDEELPELVRFQAAAKSAVPIDQLLLDFLPLPHREGVQGREVLMATIPKTLADTLRAVTSAAGLDLVSLGIGATSIAELAVRMADQEASDPGETTVVVARHPARCEILVIQNRHLLFTHAASLSVDNELQSLLMELSRALVALQGQHASLRIDRAWVLGGAEEVSFLESLEQRLRCSVQALDPFQIDTVTPLEKEPPVDRSVFAAPVGLLLAVAQPVVPAVDFLNPRKQPVARDLRKARMIAAAAGIVVLVAGVYGLRAYQLSAMDKAIEAGQTAVKKQEGELNALKPEVHTTEAVESWVERAVNWLDLTRDLAQIMNGTERYYITRFNVDLGAGRLPPKMKAEGFAKERRDIETLNNEVVRRKAVEMQPKEISRSASDPEYPFDFEMDAEFKPVALAKTDKSTGGGNAAQISTRQTPDAKSPRSGGVRQGRLP